MEFIKANLINTTTQIAVNSNTLASSNLYNRNPVYQYFSDGLANDNTTASITITFSEETKVSRIALLDINVATFNIFYNGATANSFVNSLGDHYGQIGGTDGDYYFIFNTTPCLSVTIELKSTIVANSEKVLGGFILSDAYFSAERLPSADKYKPKLMPKQAVHKMSDGGTKIQSIATKWALDVSYDYISENFKDQLETLYTLGLPFNFVGFPQTNGTISGWDGFIFESVWEGSFDFNEISMNNLTAGFSGTIRLRETPV